MIAKTCVVRSMPKDGIDGKAFLQVVGMGAFAITYDLKESRTKLTFINEDVDMLVNMIESSVPGLEFTAATESLPTGNVKLISFYRDFEDERKFFEDVLNQPFCSGELCILFVPSDERETEEAKRYLEKRLDAKLMKETSTMRVGGYLNAINRSVHRDMHAGLEDYALMRQMLDHINNASYTNGIRYKIFAVIDAHAAVIERYISNRTLVLSAKTTHIRDFKSLASEASHTKAIPMGFRYAARLVELYGAEKTSVPMQGHVSFGGSGIEIGTMVGRRQKSIMISPSSFNLGCMIAGLPGCGKTAEAMAILDGVIRLGVPVIVIAPTDEWNGFAEEHSLKTISPFNDLNRINFFRCPPDYDHKRFYLDLSMVLSSASDAGPYRRPMEKCMMNAFKSIAGQGEPDPAHVYNTLEESVIKFHGKKTAAGVKYTKHGENIKSALEGLRIILGDSRYSYREGIRFEGIARTGAVFDMSAVSSSAKPFMYALTLNQIYGIAGNFKIDGDNELRMLICIEEAQIMFKDEDSPAVIDMMQRIQDFRKRGIGIMFLTHNINDIDAGVRRLCQIKLYLRQAPDMAYLAAKDLFFTSVEDIEVAIKLKSLDSRVCALSSVVREDGVIMQRETVFIKTKDFDYKPILRKANDIPDEAETVDASVSIKTADQKNRDAILKVVYLAEEIATVRCNSEERIELLNGREYIFQIMNQKGRIYWEGKAEPSPKMCFLIEDDGSVSVRESRRQ